MLLIEQIGHADLKALTQSIKLVLLKAKPSEEIDIEELRYNLSEQL